MAEFGTDEYWKQIAPPRPKAVAEPGIWDRIGQWLGGQMGAEAATARRATIAGLFQPPTPVTSPEEMGAIPFGSVPSPSTLSSVWNRLNKPIGEKNVSRDFPVPAITAKQFDNTEETTLNAEAQKLEAARMNETIKVLSEGLRQPGTQSITIPGAGLGDFPKLALPAKPDFSASRSALMNAQPEAPGPIPEGETFQNVLAAAALGAGKGQTVGQALAFAGAGAQSARAESASEERKSQDKFGERQRQFYKELAEFERDEVRFKYSADYNRMLAEHQNAKDSWAANKPDITKTEKGVIVSRPSPDGGQTVTMTPWPAAVNAGVVGTNARKAHGYVGADAWMAEREAWISSFGPGEVPKRMGTTSWTVKTLLDANLISIPKDKGDTEAGKRNSFIFGVKDSNEVIINAVAKAKRTAEALGYVDDNKGKQKAISDLLALELATYGMQNPEIMNKFFALAHGTTK